MRESWVYKEARHFLINGYCARTKTGSKFGLCLLICPIGFVEVPEFTGNFELIRLSQTLLYFAWMLKEEPLKSRFWNLTRPLNFISATV